VKSIVVLFFLIIGFVAAGWAEDNSKEEYVWVEATDTDETDNMAANSNDSELPGFTVKPGA